MTSSKSASLAADVAVKNIGVMWLSVLAKSDAWMLIVAVEVID